MPLALSPPAQVHRATLSQGKRGTAETVAIMARLAMGEWGARSERIRALALAIIRDARIAGKNYPAEMLAVHRWVTQHPLHPRSRRSGDGADARAHRVRQSSGRLR